MANYQKKSGNQLEIKLIDDPVGQIRMELDSDDIKELAESIESLGQLQEILVRPAGERYEVVYGHRRLTACRRLGKKYIRATIRELDDIQVALMRATENIARVDISAIEEAAVYQNLRDHLGLTVDEIAKKMGKGVYTIKRRLDLLRMPPVLQQAIHSKKISWSVGEVLWSFRDVDEIEYYLQFAVENGASTAVVKGWLKDYKDKLRRQQSNVIEGGGWTSPMEMKPTYVACDMCKGPMEIGQESTIRACPACAKVIIDATGGVNQ